MNQIIDFRTMDEVENFIKENLPEWKVERMPAKGQPQISIYPYQDFAEIMKVYRPAVGDCAQKLYLRFVKGIYTEYPDYVGAVRSNDSIFDATEGVREILKENARLKRIPYIKERIHMAFEEKPSWRRFLPTLETIKTDEIVERYDGTWYIPSSKERKFSIDVDHKTVQVYNL